MKLDTRLLACTTLAALLLSGCGGKVLDYRNAEISNGKIYRDGADEPFTGTVTSIPILKALWSNKGVIAMSSLFYKFLPYTTGAASRDEQEKLEPPPAALVSLFGNDALCDTTVSQGYLDGSITCRSARTGNVVLEAKLVNGALDGKFLAYRNSGGKQFPAIVASFIDNQLDGTFELYSARSNKLVKEISYSEGRLNGAEKAYWYDTGNLRSETTNRNGLIDGEFVEYAPDGKQTIHRVHYEHGLPTGAEETFDAQTGKQIGRANYVNGKLNGLSQLWDTSGKLVGVGEWENGVVVPDPATEACQAQRIRESNQTSTSDNQRIGWYAECWEKTHSGSGASQQPMTRNDAASSDFEISEAIQKAAQKAANLETRCGWIENDMPSAMSLRDRDGTWEIASMSRMANGFDTAPGMDFPKGDSCGCVTVETDPKAHQITEITQVKRLPLKTCQNDKSLK